MSASGNQSAETSEDADDRKADRPWNIIHIRLPPNLRKYPEQTTNTEFKEVPKQINDNPGKNLIAAPEQGEASSQSPRVGLCDGANSNSLSKTQSAESQSDASGDKPLNDANDSTLSKNLRVAAEEHRSDASSYPGLSEEANDDILSMIIPLPNQELPEYHIGDSPSKNLTTTGKQSKDEHNKSSRNKLLYDIDSKVEDEEGNYPRWNPTITAVKYEKVFAEANHHLPCKKLSDDAKNKGPSNRPTDSANNKSVYKQRHTSSVQATEAKANPSRTLSTTATECDVFEHANHRIPTKKLSDVARNKAPTNRPTDPAKKSTPRKKPRTSAVRATSTSQNTSAMRLSTSDSQAVKQSKSAADLEAIKQYQEFEEKVKRTVYLDNLSHQATEAVIRAALSQFCTIRKVSFVVNYTIPYNIPQSAFVEMETEKDAEVVVSMLHDFPFMMSGMPRPVRAIHATAEMFDDRPRRPGSKIKFRWVGYPDRDYEVIKKLKLLSRKQEVENFALIEHELEEEKLLAAKQQEYLKSNFKMMETMDSVLLSGMSNYISSIYNVRLSDVL